MPVGGHMYPFSLCISDYQLQVATNNLASLMASAHASRVRLAAFGRSRGPPWQSPSL
jgi:hypothetical protein